MARFFKPVKEDFAGADIPLDLIEGLARLSDDCVVFIGPRAERQADIVVFSKWVVHVIEVKDKRGTITVDENDEWWLDGEPIENLFAGRKESPTVQAQNTARAFERFLRKIYDKRGKTFRGKTYPYVLIPHASPETRSNLARWRSERKGGWVQVATSVEELLTLMRRKDQAAAESVDFCFEPGDIQYIAHHLRMVPTEEVYGVRIQPGTQAPPFTESSTSRTPESPTARDEGGTVRASAGPPKRSADRFLWFAIGAMLILLCCFGLGLLLLTWGVGGVYLRLARESLGISATPAVFQPSPVWVTATKTSQLSPTPAQEPTVPPYTASPPPQTQVNTPEPTLAPAASPVPFSSSIAGEWSAQKNGLVLTVEKIEFLGGRFRVWMRAVNHTDDRIVLPLFKNFFVVDNLGNQYEADSFSSTFPSDVAPGAIARGYAEIPKAIHPEATSVKVMFVQVFGSLRFPYGTSIVVENIPLR
ncbi:MAG: NERD domain-containing protein [Anaerolineae bacterium]|nr:NERD domain-containing protein [Anaerolineae bacterium]